MDTNKILTGVFTAIIIAILSYVGTTVHTLEQKSIQTEFITKTLDEKLTANNAVLQDLYESKVGGKDIDSVQQEIESKIQNLEAEIKKLRIDLKSKRKNVIPVRL